MARKLFIAESIGVDEDLLAVAEQDPLAQLLWPWLLTALDDWGRGSANGARLKAAVCPGNPLVTPEVIEHALSLYAEQGLIDLYTVGRKQYWAVKPEAWWRYQTHIPREKRQAVASSIPSPPASEAPREAEVIAPERISAESSAIARECAEHSETARDVAGSRSSPSPSPPLLHPPGEGEPPVCASHTPPPGVGGAVAWDAEFTTWWAAYPRKVDRTRAARAYAARRRSGLSAADLLAARDHYLAAVRGRPPDKIRHAATLLGPDVSEWVHGPPPGERPPPVGAWETLRRNLAAIESEEEAMSHDA